MNPKRIILAGGSGFIGTALVHEFVRRDYEVIVLTRQPKVRPDNIREVAWDGKSAGMWAQEMDGAAAIINLAGKNINCRFTPENLREITASRVDSVKAIAQAIEQVKTPPRVWLQSSAVGFYGDTGERVCNENTANGNGELAQICREWEAAFTAVNPARTRKVSLRIGFVLGREGGGFPVLAGLAKKFLGGAVGNGRQYMSCIHLTDLVQMFVAAVAQGNVSGTYNAVGPEPVTNAEFMRELRGALHRPWSPPVPVFAVKIGSRLMGANASLALMSQRCVPKRFLEHGFPFKFPKVRAALDDLSGG